MRVENMNDLDDTQGNDAQLHELDAVNLNIIDDLQAATTSCARALRETGDKYAQLLDQYAALQKAHEAAQTNDVATVGDEVVAPYVLVLIDAHSHKFLDELARGSTCGGSMAAKLLKDTTIKYLQNIGLEEYGCRVIVHIYANLKSLSADVIKESAAQPRALAGFAVGFSREELSYDFVDVGHEDIVQAKIVDLFKHHIKDVQCKHILFGACCSAKYMLTLQQYSKYHEKVTLMQGTANDAGMLQLGLKRVLFSKVLRYASREIAELRAEVPAEVLASGVCWDYQREGCFRKNCKFSHTGIGTDKKKFSFSTLKPSPTAHSSQLPAQLISGLVPINSVGQRLDAQRTAPTAAQWTKFETRQKTKKACKDFFLGKVCNQFLCDFSHDPLDSDEYCVLQYIRHEFPCSKKGKCRRLDCYDGHVCQKDACANGKAKSCKMTLDMHSLDRGLAAWVKPTAGKEDKNEDPGHASQGSMETLRVPEGDLIML